MKVFYILLLIYSSLLSLWPAVIISKWFTNRVKKKKRKLKATKERFISQANFNHNAIEKNRNSPTVILDTFSNKTC